MAVIFLVMVLCVCVCVCVRACGWEGGCGGMDVYRCRLKNYHTHFADTIIGLLFHCHCSGTETAEAQCMFGPDTCFLKKIRFFHIMQIRFYRTLLSWIVAVAC
jgi:hypothetical protein